MQAPILRFASASRVIALVGEKLLGSRHGGQHQRRALEVAHLASAEQHHERSSGQNQLPFRRRQSKQAVSTSFALPASPAARPSSAESPDTRRRESATGARIKRSQTPAVRFAPAIDPGGAYRRRSNELLTGSDEPIHGHGEVGVDATVVSGVDAPPVLEFAEHVLDSVALFVEDGVVGDRGFAVGF